MRIGLLGGTFNPIHFGHLQTAQSVFHRLKLDRILFIPTGKAPHKRENDLPIGANRLKMVQLALQDYPHFKTCDIEIRRPGLSFSIDTVRALKRRYAKDTLFFIIGTDAFFNLPGWKEPERLLDLCPFVVVPRARHPFSHTPALKIFDKINKASLTQLDQKKRKRYTFSTPRRDRTPQGGKIYFVRTPIIRVTASEIRTRIMAKKSVKTLLPQPVLSYIMKKRLYNKKEDHS